MGFFSKFISAPKATPAPVVTVAVPAVLPRLGERGATAIATRAGQTPAPGAPEQPAAYIDSLLKQEKPVEAAGVLAHGLPEKDAVRWATESSDVVAGKQDAGDAAASVAAKQWLAQPTAANQAAAATAASKAGHGGPGAWAAQAAAWSAPTASAPGGATATGAAAPPAAPNPLVGKAVLGSVMLAAALSKPGLQLPVVPKLGATPMAILPPATPALPAVEPKGPEVFALYKPFIERGLTIAALS